MKKRTTADWVIITGIVILMTPLILGALGGSILELFGCSGNVFALEQPHCRIEVIETIGSVLSGYGFIASFYALPFAILILIIGLVLKAAQK